MSTQIKSISSLPGPTLNTFFEQHPEIAKDVKSERGQFVSVEVEQRNFDPKDLSQRFEPFQGSVIIQANANTFDGYERVGQARWKVNLTATKTTSISEEGTPKNTYNVTFPVPKELCGATIALELFTQKEGEEKPSPLPCNKLPEINLADYGPFVATFFKVNLYAEKNQDLINKFTYASIQEPGYSAWRFKELFKDNAPLLKEICGVYDVILHVTVEGPDRSILPKNLELFGNTSMNAFRRGSDRKTRYQKVGDIEWFRGSKMAEGFQNTPFVQHHVIMIPREARGSTMAFQCGIRSEKNGKIQWEVRKEPRQIELTAETLFLREYVSDVTFKR